MSTSIASRVSVISQHLHATREVLQGISFGAKCVQNAETRHASRLTTFSIEGAALDQAKVESTKLLGGWWLTRVVF